MQWLTEAELLAQVGLARAELRWFEEQFQEQMSLLTRRDGAGAVRYAPDAVMMLRGLSTMIAQGASPEQIKGWLGLAAAEEES